jgi:hypothetical protein
MTPLADWFTYIFFHVPSIFSKLGRDNSAQAVAIANRLGLF